MLCASCGVSSKDKDRMSTDLKITIRSMYTHSGIAVMMQDFETDDFKKEEDGFSCLFKCILRPVSDNPDLHLAGRAYFDKDGFLKREKGDKVDISVYELWIFTGEPPYNVDDVLDDENNKYNLPLRVFCH